MVSLGTGSFLFSSRVFAIRARTSRIDWMFAIRARRSSKVRMVFWGLSPWMRVRRYAVSLRPRVWAFWWRRAASSGLKR